MTADGSIDCQEDPGEQESLVSSLHYCETVSALHILAEGKFWLFLFLRFCSNCIVCGEMCVSRTVGSESCLVKSIVAEDCSLTPSCV